MKTTEAIPYFASGKSFEIVYRKNSTSTPVKPHTHDALEIYFTLTDLPDVLLGDTVSGVARGSLIVIPPHCVHQLFNQKLTVYERYIITLNSNWLSAVFAADHELITYADITAKPLVIHLADECVEELRAKLDVYLNKNKESITISDYADFFALLSSIDEYITEGMEKNSEHKFSISDAQKKVNDIIAYINDHLTEPMTLEGIADEFHLNKDYLGRLFKEHTHATAGHYISVQRVGLAQNMLAEGKTVTEVQEALGFTSYAYFFKFFKKMTGISPSRYRKSEIGTGK